MTDVRYIGVAPSGYKSPEMDHEPIAGRMRDGTPIVGWLRVDLDDQLPHDASPEDEWAFRERRMLRDAQWCMEHGKEPGAVVESPEMAELRKAAEAWLSSPAVAIQRDRVDGALATALVRALKIDVLAPREQLLSPPHVPGASRTVRR